MNKPFQSLMIRCGIILRYKFEISSVMITGEHYCIILSVSFANDCVNQTVHWLLNIQMILININILYY